LRLTSRYTPGKRTNNEVLNEVNSLDIGFRQSVWERNTKDHDRAVGLVLVKDCTKPGSYRRIGLVSDMKESFFRGCPWEPVRIV